MTPFPSGTSRFRANRLRSLATLLAAAGLIATCASFSGCARVHQKDREFLSDPIMLPVPDPMESGLEGHNLPRREGSAGGNAGSGGGCGC